MDNAGLALFNADGKLVVLPEPDWFGRELVLTFRPAGGGVFAEAGPEFLLNSGANPFN